MAVFDTDSDRTWNEELYLWSVVFNGKSIRLIGPQPNQLFPSNQYDHRCEP